MNQSTTSETNIEVEVSLQELRLKPGTELIMIDSKAKPLPHKTQFVAIFVGKSLLVTLMVDDTNKIAMREGENYLIKGFTGKYDFSFYSDVLQVDKSQFNARMSCPLSVSVKLVRNQLRAGLSLSTSITNKSVTSTVVVTDLSPGGAGIFSKVPLGTIGELLQMKVPVVFEKNNIVLELTSEICHIVQTDQGIKTGVEFVKTSQHDKLMLHYFVNALHNGD